MANSRRALLWAIFGFGLALSKSALAGEDRAGLTIERGAIVRGPKNERKLSLVFTADLYAEGATTILDTLRDRRIHASFFLTGRFLREPRFDPIVARLRDEGHLVGPHSDAHLLYANWDKPPRLLVTRETFNADLTANLRELEAHKIKSAEVRVFLPPYEHYTEEIARWTKETGLSLVNMTAGTRSNTDYMLDADPRFVSAEAIVDSILQAEKADPDGLNGYLLLMHLGAGPGRTRDHLHERLGALLDELARRAYQFVRVDELLSLAAGR
jgi:peptidoglycan/xylan/chitin deacetylase (PgdA/CDA1 family)